MKKTSGSKRRKYVVPAIIVAGAVAASALFDACRPKTSIREIEDVYGPPVGEIEVEDENRQGTNRQSFREGNDTVKEDTTETDTTVLPPQGRTPVKPPVYRVLYGPPVRRNVPLKDK